MKLQLENPAGTNLIRSYGPGQLRIGETSHATSVIVNASVVIAPWRPTAAIELTTADLEPLLGLGPEVVLLGTGARQQFPDAQVLRLLYEQRIGVEVMDTSAACRTYNVLVTEGRNVAAALIV
ncbi:MAG: Mth938-like domain-containing protein [Gammaproteobacteria bacterium]|jgi:uncharacterized protein|nr:Mth938-like domain-containing protein [Gammaproteobacteria bacterium]MDH5175360.1 Mth938-like domain-containing protein [Gammaproteobacteria bacterium]MDH5228107.1 Mth938-like domain-containing protein [Gammaproteobacteria bacterium]